ncbi:MAG: nickel-dependent hydrogenase large subunit [Candidatus Wukongarchaeota archaeon]|nr:nickel-dependent hydrogenase large subunit [Candidatus Wukongarchaeota archaeon]
MSDELKRYGESKRFKEAAKEEQYTIIVGPQHPHTHEPLSYRFALEGEYIACTDAVIGYNHRGIEKGMENRNYLQNLYIVERVCGICSASHQITYVQVCDRLAEIEDEVPDRAQYLRALVAELERMHSHMLWYSILGHDAGFDTFFMITWRDREIVMDLLELISGNRVNYAWMQPGGVSRDLPSDYIPKLKKGLDQLRKQVEYHYEVVETSRTFRARLENVAKVSKEDALKLGCNGPTLRSSGVEFDIRKDAPYVSYKELPLKVCVWPNGDVLDTTRVRLDEVLNSIEMCQYILDNLPGGDVKIKFPKRPPPNEAAARSEAPRGTVIHYGISDGTDKPWRWRIRAPTFNNIPTSLYRLIGQNIADIPVGIRAMDPCYACTDRMMFVDLDTNRKKIVTGEVLNHLANRGRLTKRNLFNL